MSVHYVTPKPNALDAGVEFALTQLSDEDVSEIAARMVSEHEHTEDKDYLITACVLHGFIMLRQALNDVADGKLGPTGGRSTALDHELERLQYNKAALGATQSLNKRTAIDVRIRQFASERGRVSSVALSSKRADSSSHIEHVVYHPRTMVLLGSIPGDLNGQEQAQHTAGALQFRIEGKMRRIKTLLGPRRQSAEAVQGARFAAVVR